jgi:O-Antigen ligase
MLTATPLDHQWAPDRPAPPLRPASAERFPRWPIAAAIASLAVLVPHGPSNTAPADVFLFIAIAATVLWAGSTRQLLRFPYLAGVGIMVVAGCVAAIFGKYPHEGFIAVAQDLFLLGWALTLANVGRTGAGARFLVRAWSVTGSAWGVGLLLYFGRPGVVANAARASFTLGEQNGAGLYFVLTLLVIMAARWPRRLRWRAPVVVCLLIDTALTGSLAAILGLLAALGLALVLGTAGRRGEKAALLVFLVLAVMAVGGYELMHHYQVVEKAQSSPNFLLRDSIGREQQSAWERQTITAETLHLWRTSTPIGLGPAATKSTLEQQQAPYPKDAHDDWTAALVERGVLGLVGLLLLAGEVTVRATRVASTRRLGSGLANILPAPQFLIGALATLLVYSFTHQILHDRTAWTLLGILAAFSTWRRKPLGSPPTADQPVASAVSRRVTS